MQLSAGATGTVTLTIASTSNAALQQHQFFKSFSLMAALVPFILIRRRRNLASLLTTAVVFCMIAAGVGCSGGTSGQESYTLQITAISADTSITHTVNIPVTITK
jgi:hypothetical protein